MTRDRQPRIRLDFALLVGYAAVAPAIELLPPGSAIRFLLVVPLAFFVPGYFATIALVPERHDGSAGSAGDGRGFALGMAERLALSFGLSLVTLPLYALLAWGFGSTAPDLGVIHLAVLALGLAAVALVRLVRTPIEDRYRPDIVGSIAGTVSTVRSYPPAQQLAAVVLAGAILSAVGMLAIGLAMPQDGETYSEFLVGTEDDDGEFVLSGYPETISTGERAEYQLLLRNHEDRTTSYRIIVEVQRLEGDEVVERETVDQFEVTLDDGEATNLDVTVEPTMQGTDLRLTFSLYPDSGSPDAEPDQQLHLWVDVVGG